MRLRLGLLLSSDDSTRFYHLVKSKVRRTIIQAVTGIFKRNAEN